jgi:benzoyl-CoA reductase subunit C
MDMNFKELCERRVGIVSEEKRKDGRIVIGTFCSYVPVEILHSFGILPVRIWGEANDITSADGLLQSYICPQVRHLMALGVEGRYDFLDGVVHCYTCDATCGLYNIWVRNLKPGFSHLVSLPYLAIPESREYAAAEFMNLIGKIEAFTGKRFSTERMEQSISLYDEARSYIKEVYHLKADGVPISYTDIYSMNLCFQTLPVEMIILLLHKYLEMAEAMKHEKERKLRIMLSGSVVSDMELVSFIENSGAEIVTDDTCLGYRLVRDACSVSRDAMEALVEYYLGRTPCSSRADFPSRKGYILEMIEQFDIDAVIFIHQKFCDPHLSDLPFLKGILDEKEIPNLQLEVEGERFNSQIRTRIEIFLEMLKS